MMPFTAAPMVGKSDMEERGALASRPKPPEGG